MAFSQDDATKPIGMFAFESISNGPEASAIVWFSVDREFEGCGYAYEIGRTACAYAFETMGLETLVAYHHPENLRSAALLARLGFLARAGLPEVPRDLAGIVKPQIMMELRH